MKKRRKQQNSYLLSIFLLLALLFLLAVVILQQMKLDELLAGAETELEQSMTDEELEKKVLLITAKEISVMAEPEALQAQCVIARTNLIAAMKEGENEPQAFTLEELQEMWGEQFKSYYTKLEDAAADTRGQYLAYHGNCMYAAYHAISAGETRAMEELYPEVQMPYLTNIECHGDAMAEDYVSVFTWSREEFMALCKEAYPDSGLKEPEGCSVQSRDSADYALTIAVGKLRITGEEFRTALKLPSACFSITVDEEKVRIVTKGCGHGLGLSQYAAEQLAKEGDTWQEILTQFYPGCELLTYKP